jgi:uncharacterized membrane protein
MGRLKSAPTHGVAAVCGLVALFATAYSLYGIFRHRHFASSAFDLGIYDQAVWHLSRFETPASSIRGYSHMLGDHFNPVMALFAPLYWLVPSPETLIVAQAFLLAASIVPVWLFLRTRLPPGVALALSAAYALSWGIQQTAAFDVHEMAFAPLFIATLILAMDQRRWPLFWAMACAIAITKEDLIPLLCGVGLYLAIAGERRRGGVLLAASLACFVVVTAIVIPAFADAGFYGYTNAYASVIERPWMLPVTLVTPAVKVRTALLWFAPFAFVALASPLSLLIVPLALIRMLSASPEHWGTIFHYTAPIAPIVAMAAGDGMSRVLRRWPQAVRTMPAFAALCVLLAAVLPGRPPLRRVLAPGHYRPIATNDAGLAALLPGAAERIGDRPGGDRTAPEPA